jgi:DNA-binding transcriptional LysR family regulator
MLNVHHLELFYYVARCEGIVAACRQIPYGIQQPAVSAQVARLEEDLGARLFERRPFRLTPAGKALYDFIAPFFGG